MYVDLLEHLKSLEETLGTESTTYKAAAQAYGDHPNLRAYRDHLGCIRLCSVDVNPRANLIEITHRTEEGGSLEVMPHIHDKGVKVYADPPIYIVGHRNPKGFGEVPLADWQELLADANLGTEIIRKVKWYLGAHQAVNYEDVPD